MENYEQKYKDALERAREELGSGCFDRGTVEYIFPELKESEDEGIRKEIVDLVYYCHGKLPCFPIPSVSLEDMLAWLEKQKSSDEALQYLKENHSPSEISDFQAAMNIAVAKAFDAGKKTQKPVDVLKKKENKLPKTWEEFCENNPIKRGEVSVNSYCYIIKDSRKRTPLADKNYLPSKDLAESMLALCQLIQLRDCYNDGWNPDWDSSDSKFCIDTINNRIAKDISYSKNMILTFKTLKIRDEFYNNFKDLLEIAKPLL